ncbi:hypothetical protein [Flavobacterium sp.]|uniref:hypothetical protein n=1 Tax=Flavobacterium sp. TaxID=239 RepID=UPI0039E5A648
MSTNSQQQNEEQELDLAIVSKKIGGFFQWFKDVVFDSIQFVFKHKIVIGLLFVLGVGLGLYLDKTQKTYDNFITVKPNYGSVDYLYTKVALLDAIIREKDTAFLERIGVAEPSKIGYIDIKPVIDVYQFVNNNSDRNFELLKLIAEDSDMKKVLEETTTSKNYSFHNIYFRTKKLTNRKKTVEPLLRFLNDNNYYKKVQSEYIKTIQTKIKANDLIIAQIDGFLNGFTTNPNGLKSEKLVYFNENSPLKDVIEMKDRVVREQADIKLDLINLDKIIKETSTTLNIENNESVNGKLKFVLPILFILLYVSGYLFVTFYKTQRLKRAQQA